jgi:polyphenol oxidase
MVERAGIYFRRRDVLAGFTASLLLPATARADDMPSDCAPIGVSGKTPVPYKPDPTLPVRVRKSAFEVSKSEVDRLKAAYSALRNLTKTDPSDPRGWLRQGYVHCWYCGGGSNGTQGEEIHGSWRFFPWHRAYLHFHERILCKLVGDDTFSLPYWDWDSSGRQTFPSVYGDPDDVSNPLFDMLRSAKPGSIINPQVVSAPIMNKTMNSRNNSLFMGSANSVGAMENSPHGPVHIWTGDTSLQNANSDMGILATAAQDPMFFAHHGNIDRLWSVWLGLSPTHKNFDDKAWRDHGWQFYDENKVWTRITISQVLDTVTSLRSTYQSPTPKPIWTFKPVPVAIAAAERAARTAPPPLVVASNQGQAIALGTAPSTKTVALPKERARMMAMASASAPQSYLHIRGIQVPPDAQAMFNVFFGLPDASPSTPLSSPNFVGTVAVVAKSKEMHAHVHPAINATFDVTGVLQDVKPNSELAVTFVPIAAAGQAPTVSTATYQEVVIDHNA